MRRTRSASDIDASPKIAAMARKQRRAWASTSSGMTPSRADPQLAGAEDDARSGRNLDAMRIIGEGRMDGVRIQSAHLLRSPAGRVNEAPAGSARPASQWRPSCKASILQFDTEANNEVLWRGPVAWRLPRRLTHARRRQGFIRHQLARRGRARRILPGGRRRHLRQIRPRRHHRPGRPAGQQRAPAGGRAGSTSTWAATFCSPSTRSLAASRSSSSPRISRKTRR